MLRLKLAVLLSLCVLSANALAEEKIGKVTIKNGVVTLAPINSRIDFVGTHHGDKPDPRKGGFAKFSGSASVDSSGALTGVQFDIETGSLWTEIAKLTGHLKSPDFFSVREFPAASFKSSSVSATQQQGVYQVKGKFTLRGVTKEITLPASVSSDGKGLTLVSDFVIDRTQFGMNYGAGKVVNEVSIRVVIGQPTSGS